MGTGSSARSEPNWLLARVPASLGPRAARWGASGGRQTGLRDPAARSGAGAGASAAGCEEPQSGVTSGQSLLGSGSNRGLNRTACDPRLSPCSLGFPDVTVVKASLQGTTHSKVRPFKVPGGVRDPESQPGLASGSVPPSQAPPGVSRPCLAFSGSSSGTRRGCRRELQLLRSRPWGWRTSFNLSGPQLPRFVAVVTTVPVPWGRWGLNRVTRGCAVGTGT